MLTYQNHSLKAFFLDRFHVVLRKRIRFLPRCSFSALSRSVSSRPRAAVGNLRPHGIPE
jgi:hypothetical protein